MHTKHQTIKMMPALVAGLLVAMLAFSSTNAMAEKPSAIALPLEGQRVDEQTVGVLNQILAGYLSQIETHKIMTMEDVETMLGFEQKKQILECDTVSCLPEIGGALGVDEILRGTVGRLGDKIIIGFTRMNVRAATVENRVSIQFADDEGRYAEGLREALWKVFKVPLPTASIVTSPDSSGSWMPGTLSLVFMATSIAAAGTGAYFGIVADEKHNQATTPLEGGQVAIDEGKSAALTANILYATGAALLVTGIALWILDDGESPKESATLSSPYIMPVVGQDLLGLTVGTIF